MYALLPILLPLIQLFMCVCVCVNSINIDANRVICNHFNIVPYGHNIRAAGGRLDP